jgi:hypothetical protein
MVENRWLSSPELDSTYRHDRMVPVSKTVVHVAFKFKLW